MIYLDQRTRWRRSRWTWSTSLFRDTSGIHLQTEKCMQKLLRLRVKQLICGSLNGMRIRQSLLMPYIPRTGTQIPRKAQRLGAEIWGLWSNPRVGAAVDCRDGLRGCEGGDQGGKCLWKKAGQPWKQGDTSESCLRGGAITIASLSPHASMAAEQ